MSSSRRWRELKRGIDSLRGFFLPEEFDPIGRYPAAAKVQPHTRAFVVLSHAEIETYLEDWAKEIARASEICWISRGRITGPMAFLLSTLAEKIRVPITLSGPNAEDVPAMLSKASTKLFQRYYKHIKDNHGIREKNVLTLFGPLGVPATALGSTLLPNLDSLGSQRGQFAHMAAKAVQTTLDPETEYKRVNDIADELLPLDKWLVAYRRKIR